MKRPKIARAMDYLDEDMIALAAQEKAENPSRRVEKPKGARLPIWTRWAAAAAAGVFLIAGGVGLAQLMGGDATGNAIVAFDVNPSLQLEIDGKEKVVKVEALNASAEEVVAGMDLEKEKLDDAVDAIIHSMVQKGYLSDKQNSLLLSVNAKGERAKRIREDVSQEISVVLQGENIQASLYGQEFDEDEALREKAERNGISLAKATLIDKVAAKGVTNAQGVAYTYEQLAGLKVNELKLLLEYKRIFVDGVYDTGDASEGKFIGRENALAIAYERANVAQDAAQRVEVELDFEEGVMLYEVEFQVEDNKYEYELNALTGEIVEEEMEVGEGWVAPVGWIDRAAALATVYQDAQVQAIDVTEVEFEVEFSGERAIYSIEFATSSKKYEYEMDGKTGEILEAAVEPR